MRGVLVCLCLLFLFDIMEAASKKELTCLTGHKILTRTKFPTIQNQFKHKLQYRCLCPNNYFGQECESHLGMDCYLTPANSLNQINSSNIKDEMEFNITFTTDCYVANKKDLRLKKIQLRQFLGTSNLQNAYGVRDQFGNNTEIIWANDTELFDSQGYLIAQKKYPNLTKEQKTKILIGDNQKLYQTPFVYKQKFLEYGLINGNITFAVDIINPQYGTVRIANYSQSQVEIIGLGQYLESYIDFSEVESRRQSLIKNITDMIKNGTLNETIKKYINGADRPKDLSFPNRSSINPQQKPLPTISISIKINPRNSTFYQAIRIQVSIIEKYQQIVTHETSLNSVEWMIPVKVQGLGLPQPIQKHLIVTDSSNKSYYKILIVVGIAALVYLALTFGYKKYKKWKNQQYTEFQDQSLGSEIKASRKRIEARRDSDSKRLNEQSERSSTSQSTEGYYKSQENNLLKY